MMDMEGIPKRFTVLCQALDAVLTPLMDDGPATASHVRAISQPLTDVLEQFLIQECLERPSDPCLLPLLLDSSISKNLVTFLVWSLPFVASKLQGADACPALQTAWAHLNFLLQGIVSAGIDVARLQGTQAAALALLERLQPAYYLTKPGKQQHK
jgi:hypothetical protein